MAHIKSFFSLEAEWKATIFQLFNKSPVQYSQKSNCKQIESISQDLSVEMDGGPAGELY